MKRRCTGSLLSLGLGLGLAGCQEGGDVAAAQALGGHPPPIAAMTDTSVPMAMGDEVDSPWEYLKNKYDADDDGRVTQDEYDRERTQFDRLDRSGDGVITAEDFARTGRGNRMQAFRASGPCPPTSNSTRRTTVFRSPSSRRPSAGTTPTATP